MWRLYNRFIKALWQLYKSFTKALIGCFSYFQKATSKTWTRTLDPDPEKPGKQLDMGK